MAHLIEAAQPGGVAWRRGVRAGDTLIAINGEPRVTSRAIFTPAAVDEFGNLTSTAIIKVPQGCCFTLSVEYVNGSVDDPTFVPTPVIEVINANLVVNRIA